MIIKTLNVTIYNQHGSAWWTEQTSNPEWADIEVAITRLDQYCYPFVWLHRSNTVGEDSAYDFNIIGGNGLYAMDGVVDAKGFTYIQPDGGKTSSVSGEAIKVLKRRLNIFAVTSRLY